MYLQLSEHPGKKMGIRENAEDFKENPNVRGYYDRVNHEIRINPAIPNSTLKFKTLVHEYAHSQLHRMDSPLKDLPRGHKEAQAEATAFRSQSITDLIQKLIAPVTLQHGLKM